MRSILRKPAAFAAIAALVLPGALPAQQDIPRLLWSNRQDGWSAIRLDQGCYLIFYRDALTDYYGGYTAADFNISIEGGCGPDGFAEGPIQMQFSWTFKGESYHYVREFQGTAHHGLLQGDGQQIDGDDSEGSLKMLDVTPNPAKVHWRDSCVAEYDPGNGQYVPLQPPDGCNPQGVQPMIDQLSAAGLLAGGGGTNAGAGASPPQPDRPRTDAEKGDVFDKCVRLVDEENEGLHDDWSLRNVCGETIIASYCFISVPPNVSDKAQCAQEENRTNEIAGGGRIDFQYSSVEWGHESELESLQAVGYACTGGNFPDVYFEDRRLKFTGC